MRADIEGKTDNARVDGIPMIERIEKEFDYIMENNIATSIKELAIDGNDLMGIGIEPGREMGNLLKKALEHVLEVPEDNTKEKLIEYIKMY